MLAKTLLSSRNEDLAALLLEVKNTLDVEIDGVISDGQQSIRKAVEVALPGIAHGLCHFHYLKEAAKVISRILSQSKSIILSLSSAPSKYCFLGEG